jgi:predicted nucleotidyltransferase
MTHEERIAIARQLAERILRKYGRGVLAIFVIGSTAKNQDRPHSDLELVVVVRPWVRVRSKYYLYRDLVIEINYRKERLMLANARRLRWRWPVEADHYRNRLVLFERRGWLLRRGWLTRLDAAVAENDAADFADAVREGAVRLVDARGRLRNAREAGDDRLLAVAAFAIAERAAMLLLLLARRYVRTNQRFFDEAFACPDQPPDFRGLVERAAGMTPDSAEARFAAAERLCTVMLAAVEARGSRISEEDLII